MKALILYTNTGAGHVSAGKAISEALQNNDIETIEIDTLTFAGSSTSKNIENTYINIVKNSPRLFGVIYKAGVKISNPKVKSIIYILNSVYSKKIYELILEKKPDIIVCTHIFCAQTISYLKKKYSLNIVTSAMVTDYTCAPFWEETRLDYYFIPHKDLIAEFENKGMDKNKLIPLGMPVLNKFKYRSNKIKMKREFGLSPNSPHILIMGGSMGAGNIHETTLKLTEQFVNAQFTVICGHNEDLYNKLKSIPWKSNVHIIQFTTEIDKIMDSADILISKPGGLTSTEAMNKGLALIMINPIPGVEIANSKFFEKHGLALSSTSVDETILKCKLILKDPSILNNIISSQTKNINFTAASDIAKFLIKKANERGLTLWTF